ncbi:MAG TPA: hypothetical protein VF366_06550 [Dehalococcoidia bacterium]
MYYDLAQIAKAKGIHRILAQLSILSPVPTRDEIRKNLSENQGGELNEKTTYWIKARKTKPRI